MATAKQIAKVVKEFYEESKAQLADSIEYEWDNIWSGEGLSDQQLVDAILDFIRGK